MRNVLATLTAIVAAAPVEARISFTSETTFETAAAVADVALADLNGDQALDVVLLEAQFGFPGTGILEVLFNNGDGTFTAPVTTVLGSYSGFEFFVDEVAAADLDGDEDLDLAFIGTIAPLTLLFNDGGGTFGSPVDTGITVDLATLNSMLDLGDLDGDRVADAIIGKPGRIAFNDGSGEFTLVEFPGLSSDNQVAIADLNGDAALDIAYGGQTHVNDGSGMFTQAGSFVAAGGAHDCAYADLDGDLDLDVACARWLADEVGLAFNDGEATFAGGGGLAVTLPIEVAAGDLDGDGAADLAVRAQESLAVFRGTGGGAFEAADAREMPSGRELAAGDLSGDGQADVVVGAGFTSTPDPGAVVILISESAPRPGDVDGDGDVDINDFLALLGTWGPCPAPCPPTCPADFDGDCAVGITDFLVLLGNFD